MNARPRHSRRLGLSALLAVAAAGALAAPALATGTDNPPSNPDCGDYGLLGFKPTPEADPTGTYTIPGTNGKTITVLENEQDTGIGWTSTLGIDKVIVKGGPGANVYSYTPESLGATGLTTPTNPNNGGPYGLSHVEFCYDKELDVSKTANASFDRAFDWDITKNVDKSSVTTMGDAVTFNYTVDATKHEGIDSNFKVKGSISVDNPFGFAKQVLISDDILGREDETCTVSGAVGGKWTVDANKVTSFGYTCSLPTKVDGTNRVTISWGDGKSDSFDASFAFVNPTNVTNKSVDVKDAFNGAAAEFLKDANGIDADDITESKTFTYSRTVDAVPGACTTYPNIATIASPDELMKDDDASVEVCRWDASKTATGAFDRAFDWNITKSVDKSSVTTTDNTVTFNYTVEATKLAGADSNFTVGGSITIDNPTGAAKDVVISDDVLGRDDENCTVQGANQGGTWTVPASGASFDYSCSLPTKLDGTNKVTISLPKEGDDRVVAVATAPFAFVNPIKITNNHVDVKDAFNGAAAEFLKDANGIDADDITESKTFTYSRTVNVPTAGCTTYPNIARIASPDGLSKDANASVKACREIPPVAPQPQPQPQATTPAAAVLGTVTPKAKLKVTKTGPRAATAGQIVTYTITVKNTGKANATAVVLRDLLPGGYSLSGKAKGATFKAGSLRWKVGTLAPGKSKTVRASFRIDRTIGGRRCNVASAAASGVATVRDTACTRIAAVAGAVEPAVTG